MLLIAILSTHNITAEEYGTLVLLTNITKKEIIEFSNINTRPLINFAFVKKLQEKGILEIQGHQNVSTVKFTDFGISLCNDIGLKIYKEQELLSKTTILDLIESFNLWWSLYPRYKRNDKEGCKKQYLLICQADPDRIEGFRKGIVNLLNINASNGNRYMCKSDIFITRQYYIGLDKTIPADEIKANPKKFLVNLTPEE